MYKQNDMIRQVSIFIILLFSTISYAAGDRMFHISRSVNANLVCYDVRLKNGHLDASDPVHVYWHNRTDKPGELNELSYIQRKMAYGYKIVNKGVDEVEIKLTAYNKRSLKVCKRNGKWVSLININGKPSFLQEIKVKSKEGNSLAVEYIWLVGVLASDGKTVVKEQIFNK